MTTVDERVAERWSRLSDRISTMRTLAGLASVDLMAIGAEWQWVTFPEEHAARLADELDKIAWALRDSIANAARAREGRAA